MNNTYEVTSEYTKIHLTHRNKGEFTTLIDNEDLPKLLEMQLNWSANVNYKDKVYVTSTKDGKAVKLHRILIYCEEGKLVDHINGNPLDNRKSNLREVTAKENQQNRQGAQSNSKSGIRGVCWVPERNKWKAYLRVNRKQIYLGLYSDVAEAEKAVIQGRNKYMTTGKQSIKSREEDA